LGTHTTQTDRPTAHTEAIFEAARLEKDSQRK
jgi:hypothetical protein